ncbi:MAG: hypothetical protein WC508_03495 [Patescibacteria group bacterium]
MATERQGEAFEEEIDLAQIVPLEQLSGLTPGEISQMSFSDLKDYLNFAKKYRELEIATNNPPLLKEKMQAESEKIGPVVEAIFQKVKEATDLLKQLREKSGGNISTIRMDDPEFDLSPDGTIGQAANLIASEGTKAGTEAESMVGFANEVIREIKTIQRITK